MVCLNGCTQSPIDYNEKWSEQTKVDNVDKPFAYWHPFPQTKLDDRRHRDHELVACIDSVPGQVASLWPRESVGNIERA